jgi:predicted porin
LIYGFGESGVENSVSDNGKAGVGFNYANSGLNLDLLYQQRTSLYGTYATLPVAGSTSLSVAGTGDSVNEYYVGGSYDFKMVKIMGSWQQQNDKNLANLDNSVWSLGAVVPVMAASNIHFSYGQLLWDNAGRDYYFSDGNTLDNSSQSAALGWTTNMSKRTTLYAGYVWVKNDNHSTGNAPTTQTGVVGETNNTFLAGMRHTF